MNCSSPDRSGLVITCEHAGNGIPQEFSRIFAGSENLLNTHRGYDIGARELADALGKIFTVYVFSSPVSRLLVDLNRSLSSRTLFPPVTRNLPQKEREAIVRDYYLPYRAHVEEHIKALAYSGKFVLHISLHTFTPVLHGVERKADIAFLYDPERPSECCLSSRMAEHARGAAQEYTVRRNYPYRGVSDSFTTHLRKHYPQHVYAGIEIEVNQKYCLPGDPRRIFIRRVLAGCITHALSPVPSFT